MNEPLAALVVPSGKGDALHFQGVSTRIKVRTEQTRGAWCLIESVIEPRFEGFKFHTHERVTETFYVLEGTLTFRLDDRTIEAPQGTLIVIPPGVWHTYWNATDTPAKYLLQIAPGGFEKFLEALAEMIFNQAQGIPTDPKQLQALAKQYDATL